MSDVTEWSDADLRALKTERDRLLARATTLENQLELVGEMLDDIEDAAERDDPATLQSALDQARNRLK